MITWSTCVHDLNPTENLCYHLKWEIHTKGKLYTTLNRWKLNTGCDKVRWLTKHWGNTGKKYFFYTTFTFHTIVMVLLEYRMWCTACMHQYYWQLMSSAAVQLFLSWAKIFQEIAEFLKRTIEEHFPPYVGNVSDPFNPTLSALCQWVKPHFFKAKTSVGVEQRIKLSHWLFLFKQHWQ